MRSNRISWGILGLAFIGMVFVSLAGIALLAVLVGELAEIGWAVPNFAQASFACRKTWQNSTGTIQYGGHRALRFLGEY
jgi:hypothetical protein